MQHSLVELKKEKWNLHRHDQNLLLPKGMINTPHNLILMLKLHRPLRQKFTKTSIPKSTFLRNDNVTEVQKLFDLIKQVEELIEFIELITENYGVMRSWEKFFMDVMLHIFLLQVCH